MFRGRGRSTEVAPTRNRDGRFGRSVRALGVRLLKTWNGQASELGAVTSSASVSRAPFLSLRFSFLVGGGRGGSGVTGKSEVVGFGIRFVFEYFYLRICGGVGVPGGV